MSAELVDRFENADVRYGPVPLWWWSGERLERDRLRWQMEQLVSQGVYQAVVMNLAPTGPLYGALADDPPFMSEEWWAIFTDVCSYAEELGFQVWLYDQIGFSGANLQGTIVAAEPHYAGRTLTVLRGSEAGDARSLAAPDGSEPLAAWFVPADGSPSVPVPLEGRRAVIERSDGELVLCFSAVRGFDYFSIDACAALIDTIYGEYRRRVGSTFGRGIGGVFQDELPDVPTWSIDFAGAFADEAGYDVLAVLPALWGDPLPDGAPVDADRARLDYHRARATFARRAFFDPLAAWLSDAGLRAGFDQQSPAREGEPVGATQHYGDYLETHSTYAIPGSDHWGDSKVHSSLAHAHGHERVWIESFHSSGWGGTLEETYDWLTPYFRRGANLYDPHAVYYSTRSGWFEWAPPSTCWRQPYWPDYHLFSAAVTRLSSVLTVGDHVASTVLFFPTEFVQSRLTAGGVDLGAGDAESAYFALNGLTPWFAEQRGLLEKAGVDFDILGAYSLRGARAVDGELVLRGERYRNVVLPAVELLPVDTAMLLADFAEQGGRILCIGRAPERFVAPTAAGEDGVRDAEERFARLAASGALIIVESSDEAPAQLRSSEVSVTADAPVLHRVVGDVHVVAAIAHDERSGTVQPMLGGFSDIWDEGAFNWKDYWFQLSTEGYRFVPPRDRQLTVRFEGLAADGLAAQLWDPRTGLRAAVPMESVEGGIGVRASFAPGSFALLVVGPDLPSPTAIEPGSERARQELTGNWTVQPESTLDNRWGDVARRDEPGIVPVQVWRFDHTAEGEPGTRPVVATFGPFAEISREDEPWTRAEWSLSRGIRNDTIHDESLGPNGYVPEEFVQWREAVPGRTYRLRTTISVPDVAEVRLAVGADAARTVRFDGAELPAAAPAYLSFSALPSGRTGLLELEFTATQEGDLRAFFALTTDPGLFARPEWIETGDQPARSTTVVFRRELELGALPTDTRVQLSTEAPSVLLVNGTEVGRQSDFDAYAVRRFTRVHPYDLRALLHPGTNLLEVRSTDVGRPVAIRLDSVPATRGGLGIRTDDSWSATREGGEVPLQERYQQWEDPRYGCLVPRPHPLQEATWLETEARDPSVLSIVPDVAPTPGRVELLSFDLPVGAVELRVPTAVPFSVDGNTDARVDVDRVLLTGPADVGSRLTLRFVPEDGRREGALLDGPLEVRCEAAEAPLVPWHELGLSSLGGAVHYRRRLDLPDLRDGERLMLDLGAVRGTVEVRADDAEVGSLFAGPWRVDLTDAARAATGGAMDLQVTVRGTLAPYLDVASPTSAVMAGQTVHGLFGPVTVETWTGAASS